MLRPLDLLEDGYAALVRLDWLSPLVWVPATLLVCSGLVWVLISMSLVSENSGGLCGSALHWYSRSATGIGGEVSPAQRAEENGACHQSAAARVHTADWTLAVGVGVAGAAAAFLSLRRRFVASGV